MFDMDISLIVNILRGSVGVYLSTEIVKYIKFIPINEGQKLRIRSLAAGLSMLATGIMAVTSGNLDPKDVQSWLIQVVMFVGTWGWAEIMHRVKNLFDKVS